MASFTFSAPTDIYAHSSGADWSLGSISATQVVFETADGRLTLGGTGFAYNGAVFTGTITSAQLYDLGTNGATLSPQLLAQTTSVQAGLTLPGLINSLASNSYGFQWAGIGYLLSGNDLITGSSASDYLGGGAGNDTINGGTGDDYLLGDDYGVAGGNDSLVGGDGNDNLDGGGGVDTMVGGTGDDSYTVDQAGDVVVEAAGGGNYDRVTVNAGYMSGLTSYTLTANVENLDIFNSSISPTAAAFIGRGNDLANKISCASYGGTDGTREALYGFGGNDRLSSGGGNDTLDGGTGNDTLLGGGGSDTYYVDALADVVSESLIGAAPTDADTVVIQIAGAATYSLGGTATGLTAAKTFAGIENLTLGSATTLDALNGLGSTAANALTGNAGANKLFGLGGNDSLFGGVGNDSLDGGTEADVLNGGAGADTLVGGAGNDRFVFSGIADVGLAGARDVVSDLATGDKLDFSVFDNNTALAGVQDLNFTFLGSGAFTANAATGQLRFAGGVLYGNTDADTAAEFEIVLTGRTSVAVTDFLL